MNNPLDISFFRTDYSNGAVVRPIWYINLAGGRGVCAPLLENNFGLDFGATRNPADAFPAFEKKLHALIAHLSTLSEPQLTEAYQVGFKEAFKLHTYPAIITGLETAYLTSNLIAPLSSLLSSPFSQQKTSVPINFTLLREPGNKINIKETNERFLSFSLSSYSALKLKIGCSGFHGDGQFLAAFQTDLEVLADIRNHLPNICLRLDANCSFPLDDQIAVEVLEKLAQFNIEYLEQPTLDEHLLTILCRSRIVDIALDESLIGERIYSAPEKRALIERVNPQRLILKPTNLGGFRECDEWLDISNTFGFKPPTITSTMECGYMHRLLGDYVSLRGLAHATHGLSTFDHYDKACSFLRIEDGRLYSL